MIGFRSMGCSMKKLVIVFVGIVISVCILGCSGIEKYTLIFDTPKNGEVITNENLRVVIQVVEEPNPDDEIRVFINGSMVYVSKLKKQIDFETQITEKSNKLEVVISREGAEITREEILFSFKKPLVKVKKMKKEKYRAVKARGIKKYEEIKPMVAVPMLEEKKLKEEEKEYVHSVSLDILNERPIGYFKDIVVITYRVNVFREFAEKVLDYVKGVYVEISDERDSKLFREFFREPGMTLELDISGIPTGTYSLTVIAEDKEGRTYETSRWIRVDKTPPKITLERITNDTIVRGTYSFSMRMEDPAGILNFEAQIEQQKINYRIQDGRVIFSFDSTKVKNGRRGIKITVSDRLTNTFETNLQVIVDNWFEEVVDSNLGAGFHVSAFVDEEENIYLAYHNIVSKNLMFGYKSKNMSSWFIETVDKTQDTGKYPSIFVDGFNRIHIAYTYINEKWDDEDLKYAIKEDKDWKIMTLDSQDKAGRYTSIVVDSKGVPHISYYNYTVGSLRYMTYNIRMGRWEVSVPDSYENVGSDTSIDIFQDTIHIVYLDNGNGDLKYCKKGIEETDAGWKFEVIDSDGKVGYYAKMKIDREGNIHVAYYDSTRKALKYAVKSGGVWRITTIDRNDDPGRFISLYIDKNNNPHISYFVKDKNEIRYAFFDGKTWDIQTVVSDRAGGWSSIVVVDGKPMIFFYDQRDNILKVAKK